MRSSGGGEFQSEGAATANDRSLKNPPSLLSPTFLRDGGLLSPTFLRDGGLSRPTFLRDGGLSRIFQLNPLTAE